ncbi:SRPBCC family protein [Streptomyces sp. NPDC051940]|uniref:SRPBCC family protein n=1 Tax=Streptomyces sp. NPDC051940 TaxID=3155675 RepID=UPI00342055EF
MELQHEFTVPVPTAEAWEVLLDIERIAPCMPGASVEDYDGDTVKGAVKVKVGPITVTYQGTAEFVERDEKHHRMVLVANGREVRGHGTARAQVTGQLHDRDDGTTAVAVFTDLTITGRPAQFGRGVMAEVGEKLVGQFAECLAERLGESARSGPGSASDSGSGLGAEVADEPIDLLRTAGVPVGKRLGALVAAGAALVLAVAAVRRRFRRRRGIRRLRGRSR